MGLSRQVQKGETFSNSRERSKGGCDSVRGVQTRSQWGCGRAGQAVPKKGTRVPERSRDRHRGKEPSLEPAMAKSKLTDALRARQHSGEQDCTYTK